MDGTGVPAAGSPRARRVRIGDVAERVGVSCATVSLVMRGAGGPSAATRERVLRAAGELGYRPDRAASLLAGRRTHLLGVLLDVTNSFHAELVAAVHAAAERCGFDVVVGIVPGAGNEQRAAERLLDFRCEALLLLGPTAAGTQLTALARQLPVIVVGRRLPAGGPDVVRAADDQGVGLAVDHLVGQGHRRILFVDGGRGTIASDRRRGYRRAMRRHGLGDWDRILPGEHTEEAGMRAAREILRSADPPTAVVASNDRCALGLLDVLKRRGLEVPEFLSVVGYDDSPPARLAHVGLTTVSQNVPLLADHAVEAAVERIDGRRSVPRAVVLTPLLVVRGTTGPPRHGRPVRNSSSWSGARSPRA